MRTFLAFLVFFTAFGFEAFGFDEDFFAAGLLAFAGAAFFTGAVAALAFTCFDWRQTSESGAAAQTPRSRLRLRRRAASALQRRTPRSAASRRR